MKIHDPKCTHKLTRDIFDKPSGQIIEQCVDCLKNVRKVGRKSKWDKFPINVRRKI